MMDADAVIEGTLADLSEKAGVSLAIRALSAQLAAQEMRRHLARNDNGRGGYVGAVFD